MSDRCDRRGPVVAVSSHLGAFNFCRFLADWARPEHRRWLAWLPHDRFLDMADHPSVRLPPGSYLLGDPEYLDTDARRRMIDAVARLGERPDRYRVHNPPDRALSRVDLHAALNEANINGFRSRTTSDAPPPGGWRFPVFLRSARDHDGTLGDLIHDEATLRESIRGVVSRGGDPSLTLVVEYADPRGPLDLCWKYGVFRVGDQLVPRHAFASAAWMIKHEDPATLAGSHAQAVLEHERAFLEGFDTTPYAATIRRAFDIAGITYGRLDFGLHAGRPQVWEINTNPTSLAHNHLGSAREPIHRRFFDRFADALDALRLPDVGPMPRSLRRRCAWERLPWRVDGLKRRAERDRRPIARWVTKRTLSVLKRLPGNRYPWVRYE